ncbi:MAG TPA: FtsQ-type POTRA domain-containing protein [Verrucomicrobiae bacterium]|nr:FtsQ-type POTRA domain-containing protein [Verrucomicrobiae bacterium]
MWFRREKNKNRNRRLGRTHVLDVKLRSDQVRANRMRLGAIMLSVVCGTFFGLYLIWRTGELLLDKFVYHNPDFAIQNVEIQTDGVISKEQLRRWSNVKPGANLFALDLANVRRSLEMESAIEMASVEKVLPHTLRIRVTERSPIAEVDMPCTDADGNLAMAVTQLDKNSVAMKPRDPHECIVPVTQLNPQLPVISGLDPVKLKLGEAVPAPDAANVQAALGLVSAFGRSPMAGLVDLRRVDISSPGVLIVSTGQGTEVTFALQDFDRQLRRWRQIYDLGMRQQRTIASVDLAVANNVPVRWMLASTAPVAAPKPKPLKNRRNNV